MVKRNISVILYFTLIEFLSMSIFYGTSLPLILAKDSVFPLLFAGHDKAIVYGLVLVILPLGQFLLTPLWGQLSDVYGRKIILFLTLLGSAFAYLVMAVAISGHVFGLFILGRVLSAMLAANLALGQASLADMTGKQGKAGRFNLQFIAISLGFILGPYLISMTTHGVNYANIYWVIAIGYVLAFVFVSRFYTETLAVISKEPIEWLRNISRIFTIFKQPELKGLFIIWLIFQIGWNLFFQYSGEFLYLKHHLDNDSINHLMSWLGVGSLLVQVFLVQWVARKVHPSKIIPWAIAAVGLSLLAGGFLPINWSFYVMIAVYCLGIAFFLTNFYAHVSNHCAKDQQGRAMAMLSSGQALMNILVTIMGSFVVGYYLATPYVLGGLIVLVALLVFVKVKGAR